MNALAALASNRSRQIAAELVDAMAGGDGLVCYEDEAVCGRTAVLDRAAAQLGRSRVRVIRVAVPASGTLGLPELVAQVAGQANADALSDGDVERAFQVLTEPDEGCAWIALLVDDAECLLPSALRYVQLTCRSVPELRVLLAGEPGFRGLLDGEEFAPLRQRLDCVMPRPAQPDEGFSAVTPPPCPARIEAEPARAPAAVRRPLGLWVLVALVVLASVGVGVWSAHRHDPAPSTAAAAAG